MHSVGGERELFVQVEAGGKLADSCLALSNFVGRRRMQQPVCERVLAGCAGCLRDQLIQAAGPEEIEVACIEMFGIEKTLTRVAVSHPLIVESREAASLFLLAGGGPVANPPALLGHAAMADLLRQVSEDFDYVLIDAPSPLEFSDVMPLLKLVDAIVVVARAGHTREMSAQRLVQLLGQSDVRPIGVAANCLPSREMKRYGFATGDGRGRTGKLMGR